MSRCQCKTLSNYRCSLNAIAGTPYCRVHQGCVTPYASSRRGTPKGTRDVLSNNNVLLTKMTTYVPQMPGPPSPVDPSFQGQYQVLESRYMRNKVKFSGPPFASNEGVRWVYNYSMPAVTVDLVVFDPSMEKVLLIQRGINTEPQMYAGQWAVPGGFMEQDETATQAAIREFNEEVGTTNIDINNMYHVYTATQPYRDIRQRTVSVVFTTVLDPKKVSGQPVDQQEIGAWRWMNVSDIMNGVLPVAFDHQSLIARAWATQSVMKKLPAAQRFLLSAASTDKSLADLTKGKGKK